MKNQIILQKIQIEGPSRLPAVVEFKAGLNAIVGASDTGKSYIFQALEYMLGGSEIPKPNPNSDGYNRGWLQILDSSGAVISIERVFGEDAVNVYDSAINQPRDILPRTRIRASHQTNSKETLSYLIMSLIGLSDKQVRKNQQNEKNSVTFRFLAHLTMVDEQRVITNGSPALTGQYTQTTVEKGILSLLLTGNDDSALTDVVLDKKTRNASLDAQIGLLERIIDEKSAKLKALILVPEEIEPMLAKINLAIQTTSKDVSATRQKINELETKRQNLWVTIEEVRSRQLVLKEQLKRLKLLLDYYKSDSSRLQAVLEAGTAFEQLPTGECSVCGRTSQPTDKKDATTPIQEFQQACRAELEKITVLTKDLNEAVSEFQLEADALKTEEADLSGKQIKIDAELNEELKPTHENADASLEDLIKLRADLTRANDLHEEIREFHANLEQCQADRKLKTPRGKPTVPVDTRMAYDFCQVITDVLKTWKYPLNGTVSFDPTKFDIVIGNQDRGSMGKGYRAITHAAFTIALMRFCRSKGLPHSGFVVLDSPLNPFRGQVIAAGPDGGINAEIKDAFYRDLAADKSGNQYIILENTEPPTDLTPQMNYIQFTQNTTVGRFGFFPSK